MKHLFHWLRYDWPLHFVLRLTDWLPDNVIFFRLRGWLARPFFGSCGKDLRLGRHLTIYNAFEINLGSHIYMAYGCILLGIGQIHIEDEVMFAPYVVVSSGNHTKLNGSYRFGPGDDAPIHIGSGSWIGAHATLLAGAHIGRGCVIGSNAAVTRSAIPDHSFAAGVPAVVKRTNLSVPSEFSENI